jgi:hypothetical protein
MNMEFFSLCLGIVIGWVLAHIDFIDDDGEGW